MPGVGPITIFDKSALESLNPDESVWFDCFYLSNITPLFYVETLADLRKKMRDGRTPEQVVGNIANKMPELGTALNVHHHALCVSDLMGLRVRMERYPVVGGARSVTTGNGLGIVIERPPEMEAFERWQKGEFLDVERLYAKAWRQDLASVDLNAIVRNLGLSAPIRADAAEVKSWADSVVAGHRNRFGTLKASLEILGVPENFWRPILARWKSAGGPPLKEFAPYAAHVFAVDLFFVFALAAGVISANRPSNMVDIAYLYYLPFCMVFVSGDKLHQRIVPHFIGKDQDFVWAPDLKTDLAKLDLHFSSFPEEVKAEGLFKFASWPPEQTEFLTTRLWDRHLPDWRTIASAPRTPDSAEEHGKLITWLDEIDVALPASKAVGVDEARFMKTERYVRPSKGKWRILPPDVENATSGDDS